MTIEKALVRLLKESYKGEGYTVVVPLEDPEMLALAGEDWTIQIPLKAAPAKALGLLVEHMRRLPSPGQAYRVRKREIQVEMYDLLMDQLRDYQKKERIWITARATDVTLGGRRLWWAEVLLPLRPEVEELLMGSLEGNCGYCKINDLMRADLGDTLVWVRCGAPRSKSEEAWLERLGRTMEE